MLYLPISKTWVISRSARRLYFVCALLGLMLFGTFFATSLAMDLSGVRSLREYSGVMNWLNVLLFPEIVGTATLTVAMWYFWFTFDKSSWGRRAIWFLPLYLLSAIGPALYYFFVYRRSAEVAAIGATVPELA